jgi:hypothetical protein
MIHRLPGLINIQMDRVYADSFDYPAGSSFELTGWETDGWVNQNSIVTPDGDSFAARAGAVITVTQHTFARK